MPAVAVVTAGVVAAIAGVVTTGRANEAAQKSIEMQNAQALATLREQGRPQAASQRHQRVEEQRAKAYLDLIEKARREQLAMLRIYPVIEMVGMSPALPAQLDDDAELALLARVVAYGSPAIDDLRREWAEVVARFAGLSQAIRLGEAKGTTTMMQERIDLEEIRRSALPVIERLEARVRYELQGHDVPSAT